MTVAWIFLAVFGLIIGSFLNVCIGRLPAGESVVSPGSRCPSCRVAIRWFDNIPVLSYLVLGGRCRACGASISVRYPIVEAVTSLAFLFQGAAVGDDPPLLASRLLLTTILIILFGTDLETQRLPDVLTKPGIVVGVLFSVFLPPGLFASLAGAAFGGGILFAIGWGWQKVTGEDAMGGGDVKMLAMIGAFLGWRLVIVVLFLSSLTGAVVGVGLWAIQGRSLKHKLPYGTFIAVSAYAASIVGDSLVTWYLKFYQ